MQKFVFLRFFPAILLILFFVSGASSETGTQTEDLTEKLIIGDYKGRVVYFDFWASWCVPCKKSFPWLNKIQKKYKSKGLEVVTINLDKNKELAGRFLKEFSDIDLKVIYDPEGVYARKYKITGMPSTLIFDRDGQISETHVGFRAMDSAMYEEEIKRLL